MTQQSHYWAYTPRKPELKERRVPQCWSNLDVHQLLLLLLSRFSRVWLCVTWDGSPPGSPVPGILQARTLEWVAISFSNAWNWKNKVKLLSRVRLLVTPWTAVHQAPPSMGFSRQEYWSGLWLPSPCPSADEWIRKLWYIYTMEYSSAIKKNTFESVLMRWRKLEPIIQSEVSQKEKHQYSILTHIYGI